MRNDPFDTFWESIVKINLYIKEDLLKINKNKLTSLLFTKKFIKYIIY